jgi:uncharacterized membrane protein
MSNRQLVIRSLSIAGLATSAALAADHLTAAGAFCDFDAGCGAVTASAYGSIAGVPVSAFGVVGVGLLVTLALLPGRRAVVALRLGAAAAALAGVALLILQVAALRRICPLCVVADLFAVGVAALAVGPRPEDGPGS